MLTIPPARDFLQIKIDLGDPFKCPSQLQGTNGAKSLDFKEDHKDSKTVHRLGHTLLCSTLREPMEIDH